MDIKYTKDGKKVAVIGKLNNEQWIVQEIFVANGKEFPAGENFTTKTLLDEPAETWQTRHNRETELQKEKLKDRIKQLDSEACIIKRKARAGELINRITKKYQDINIAEFETLVAFMMGQITHIVIKDWRTFRVLSLIDTLENVDNHGSWSSFDGLKLVTLFGCNSSGERWGENKSFSKESFCLEWRINQYRDGSGSETIIYPCTSHEEAVKLIDNLVAKKEKATAELIELKEKYNLKHPTMKKIQAYKKEVIKGKKETIKNCKGKLNAAEQELGEAIRRLN